MKTITRIIVFLFLLFPVISYGQMHYSISTDLSLLRNFDGRQPFTVPGQTVALQWHTDTEYTVYSYFTYHWEGKYASSLQAVAKQPSTTPQQFSFLNRSRMNLHHLSLGIKKFITGSFRNDDKMSAYFGGGFGLILGKASNTFSVAVDTSQYYVQDNIINGSGRFKRLSFDITGGIEYPVGYEVFIFSELRLLIPTTGYPSSYLLKNNNAPFLGSINFGFRILFNDDQE